MPDRPNEVMVVGERDMGAVKAGYDGVEAVGLRPVGYIEAATAYEHLFSPSVVAVLRIRDAGPDPQPKSLLSRLGFGLRQMLKDPDDPETMRLGLQARRSRDLTLFHQKAVSLGIPYLLLEPRAESGIILPSPIDLSETLFYEPGDEKLSASIAGWLGSRLLDDNGSSINARRL